MGEGEEEEGLERISVSFGATRLLVCTAGRKSKGRTLHALDSSQLWLPQTLALVGGE